MGTTKNGWKIGCYVLLIALAASGVLNLIGAFSYVSAYSMLYFMQYGVGMTTPEFVQSLFSVFSMFVMAVVAFAVGVLLIRSRRELFAKIFVWAMLLLAVFGSYQFVASAFLLPSVTVSEGFTVFENGAPRVLVVAVLIALIAQWDDSEKKFTNRFALLAAVVNAIFGIIRLVNSNLSGGATYALYLVFEVAVLVILPLTVFFLTKGRRIFNTMIYGMTEDEAAVVEEMEDRLEEQKERYEEEAIEKIEQQIEEELRGALKDRAADLATEDAAEAGEEIAEQLAELEEGAGKLQDLKIEVEAVEVTEEAAVEQENEEK